MGNVLAFFSHDVMCEQIGAVCNCTKTQVQTRLIESGVQWDFEKGKYTGAEFHLKLQELFRCEVDYEDLYRASSDIFQLNTSIVPLLTELKSHGMRLVLLSNTSEWHFQWIRDRYNVLSHFDDFCLSYRVGALKPEEAIYHDAISRIQCKPQECFYTDDISDYILEARNLGLHAEVYRETEELRIHLKQLGAG